MRSISYALLSSASFAALAVAAPANAQTPAPVNPGSRPVPGSGRPAGSRRYLPASRQSGWRSHRARRGSDASRRSGRRRRRFAHPSRPLQQRRPGYRHQPPGGGRCRLQLDGRSSAERRRHRRYRPDQRHVRRPGRRRRSGRQHAVAARPRPDADPDPAQRPPHCAGRYARSGWRGRLERASERRSSTASRF